MHDPVKTFDDACKARWRDRTGRSFGKRFLPKSPSDVEISLRVAERVRWWVQTYKDYSKSTADIHFDFIDNPQLNALADVIERRGYIGMFFGATQLLRDLFLRMLSHPDVLPFIGDATCERLNPQHSDGLAEYFDELCEKRRLEGNPVETIAPNDPTRKLYAMALTKIALDFLAVHEINHIYNGHCGYCEAQGIPFIIEAKSNRTSADPLVSQAIEADADIAASHAVLRLWMRDMPHREYGDVLSKPLHITFSFEFALSGLFRLWGLGLDLNRLKATAYPHTAMRRLLIRMKAIRALREGWPDLVDDYPSHARAADFFADQAIERIGAPPPAQYMENLRARMKDPLSDQYLQAIIDKTQAIKPDLKPHELRDPRS